MIKICVFFRFYLHFWVIFSYVCQEEWPTAEQYYYYTLALLTLQFLIPLSVLIFTYIRIALTVWGKRPPGEALSSRDQRLAHSKRKVSTSRTYLLYYCHLAKFYCLMTTVLVTFFILSFYK